MVGWSVKRRVMRHYDRIAKLYDRRYLEEQTAKIRAALRILRRQPDGLILDVGCGTGLLFEHLKSQARLLVGVDLSRRILEIARQRAKGNGDVELVQADADHLPFTKRLFDVVFAVTLIQNMPNPARTLREIRAVTKPRGHVVVTALKKSYSKESFAGTIKNAELEIKGFLDDPCLKGYVAACVKTSVT